MDKTFYRFKLFLNHTKNIGLRFHAATLQNNIIKQNNGLVFTAEQREMHITFRMHAQINEQAVGTVGYLGEVYV